MRLLKQLSRDYLRTEDQLVARSHSSVRATTARLLIALCDGSANRPGKATGQVTMAREEMAMLIGTTRETLSRTLGQLANRGAISLARQEISVSDLGILERLSD